MIFNFRLFKSYTSKSLSNVELRFLFRTFFHAAVYFFAFGFFIFCVSAVFNAQKALGAVLFAFLLLATVPCGIGLVFMSYKYRKNPLAVSGAFVGGIYTLLTLTFAGIFLTAITGVSMLMGSGVLSLSHIVITILCLFGSTAFIYLIPAVIGLYIRNRGIILNLSKFISFCFIAYTFLFLFSVIMAIFGLALTGFYQWLMFLLLSVIIFSSPIVTIFRLKTVVPYINHEDENEAKKWESYFAFEISFQLLQMALHLLRIAAMFLTSRSSK